MYVPGWAHQSDRVTILIFFPVGAESANTRNIPIAKRWVWIAMIHSASCDASPAGARSYRETGGDGAILYVVEEEIPSRRLVTRIADRSLPFGGAWTFDLLPNASGTILRITEDGEVYNPVYRFMSAFVFGHHATIDTYLTDLGSKFKTTVSISDASR